MLLNIHIVFFIFFLYYGYIQDPKKVVFSWHHLEFVVNLNISLSTSNRQLFTQLASWTVGSISRYFGASVSVSVCAPEFLGDQDNFHFHFLQTTQLIVYYNIVCIKQLASGSLFVPYRLLITDMELWDQWSSTTIAVLEKCMPYFMLLLTKKFLLV